MGAFGTDKMKTIIHINQHKIKSNAKTGAREPVITVKTYKDNQYGSSVNILDKKGNIVATIKYQPDNPLSCGAKCWIETNLSVEVL